MKSNKNNQIDKRLDKPMIPNPKLLEDLLYTENDIKDLNYEKDLGSPGQYPFTRGIRDNMYQGRLWTMRQYAGFASPEKSNQRYLHLLQQGQTGLSVAFELPTQTGYDSDHDLAFGEVGRAGVPISSLIDMEILLDRIPLDQIIISMTINSTASILLAMYIAVAEKKGIKKNYLRGTLQNDILKEYIARGTYIFPPKAAMKITTDIFQYCSENMPSWNSISIGGYHMREAGATASQELGFTFSNAIAYVRSAIDTGLDIDDFAPRLSFFFACQNDFFEEICKFRAARRIWAKIMKNRFRAKNPKSWVMRFHCQTAGVTLTAQQPDNNIVRTTIQALAAVLGGTQSLHVNSKDEALALPTEESAEISLRTQQIIAHESGVIDTVDPLGGSYFIESKTNQLEKEAFEYIDKIENFGGAVSGIRNNFQSKEIESSAYLHQLEVESGRKIIVGVNKYDSANNYEIQKDQINIEDNIRQIERLNKMKIDRDANLVKKSLGDLNIAVKNSHNVMPFLIECVKNYATLGEISDVLRNNFGEHV